MPDFTIGADPEFALLDSDGDMVAACEVIRGGCDGRTKFGIDGCQSIGELRPSPSTDPIKVVKNIRVAMARGLEINRRVRGLEWKAGSSHCDYALGGHIHFGVPLGRDGDRFASALDTYVAQPVLLLEDEDEAKERRNDGGYGELSDYRSQPWGFEYRTLSSWITSPAVASAVLSLAKVVMYEAVNHDLHAPGRMRPSGREFNAADKPHFRRKFPTLWSHIKKMSLYDGYKEHINLIEYLVQNGLNWFPDQGTRKAWGLPVVTNALPAMAINKIWDSIHITAVN